jgi:hypothetical protein
MLNIPNVFQNLLKSPGRSVSEAGVGRGKTAAKRPGQPGLTTKFG